MGYRWGMGGVKVKGKREEVGELNIGDHTWKRKRGGGGGGGVLYRRPRRPEGCG